MKFIFIVYIAVFTIFFIGCDAPANKTSSAPDVRETVSSDNSGKLTVEVYKYKGAVQCYGGGTDLAEMACELTDKGITVLSSYSDTDGFYHIKVCGADSGDINIFEIYEDDLESAVELGFNSIEELI